MVEKINFLLQKVEVLWVLIISLAMLLLFVGYSLYTENKMLKRHLKERNNLLKEKFKITEDLL